VKKDSVYGLWSWEKTWSCEGQRTMKDPAPAMWLVPDSSKQASNTVNKPNEILWLFYNIFWPLIVTKSVFGSVSLEGTTSWGGGLPSCRGVNWCPTSEVWRDQDVGQHTQTTTNNQLMTVKTAKWQRNTEKRLKNTTFRPSYLENDDSYRLAG
jgi:hypothetical protein